MLDEFRETALSVFALQILISKSLLNEIHTTYR